MAGLASLFASLLIALAIQRKLWDDPDEAEPLSLQLWLLVLLVALAASIAVIAGAAVEGDTELTHWEKVLTSTTLGGGLIFLVGTPLNARLKLLGSTLEPRIPTRLRPVARVLWTWGVVLIVTTWLVVDTFVL